MPSSITKSVLTRRAILRQIEASEPTLRQYQVKRIGLFGSFAENRQRSGSDIDLVVEFSKPTFDNFMGLSDYLERLFKRKVDLMTPESLSSYLKPSIEKQTLWHEVR